MENTWWGQAYKTFRKVEYIANEHHCGLLFFAKYFTKQSILHLNITVTVLKRVTGTSLGQFVQK